MPGSRLDTIFGVAKSMNRLDPRPDAELIARFLDFRDESAFELLVFRHVSAVRAACRVWLRVADDIDDASQAAFIVLARRAGSIRNRDAVGAWLYGVAANIARRLRNQHRSFAPLPGDLACDRAQADDDLAELLNAEIARLPEKYRLPVQLCYGAGLTTTDAAGRLGWAKGTLLTRLAWARRRLQQSLARRGVAPEYSKFVMPAAAAAGSEWMRSTARAAVAIADGLPPAAAAVSTRAILLAEGVICAMMWNKLKYIAFGTLVAAGLVGSGLSQSTPARNDPDKRLDPNVGLVSKPVDSTDRVSESKPDESKPGTASRRREAVIRLPRGTFVKEVDVPPYGSGRLTWTYEDERVVGTIEGTAMGGEFELSTEAEFSLSSTGVIYGVLTSVRLTHVKLPEMREFAELKPFAGLWPAIEPLVNEITTDLPFSYRCYVQGDRLVISQFRMLLAGPNPFGKLGGLAANGDSGKVLMMFQALGTAFEGTYSTVDANPKPLPAPTKRPLFRKPVAAPKSEKPA